MKKDLPNADGCVIDNVVCERTMLRQVINDDGRIIAADIRIINYGSTALTGAGAI